MADLFTSESVTEGHPDKMADQVADGILDALLAQDPLARVACEVLITTGLVVLAGEVTTGCYVDLSRTTRHILAEIGYAREDLGFDARSCAVLTSIDEQSPDIAIGVGRPLEDRGGSVELGAGDQGLMFGYATDETPELMPLPVTLAQKLTRRLARVRHERILPYVRPDGKAQVTIESDGNARRVHTLVLAVQHDPDAPGPERFMDAMRAEVIDAVVGPELLDADTRILVNPTGRFVAGGPSADTGVTGRKIIVDTYGGSARHGGGALSGKDPTKVDRSGAYAARWMAKHVVAAGWAQRCEVQVAYAIGVASPVSVRVETFGTGRLEDSVILQAIRQVFDLRPRAIIEALDLRRPIYRPVAAYGHFGRPDLDLPWERLNRLEALRTAASALR